MAEYIERESAKRAVDYAVELSNSEYDAACNALDGLPAADVAPVVHGRWVKHTRMHGFVYCSACKDVYLDEEWLRDGKWGYCPNCGAKMDGGDGDETD